MVRRYVRLELSQEIDIVTRYEEGESHLQIGERYNISNNAILRVVHKHNATIRSVGQPRKYVKNFERSVPNLIVVSKIGDEVPVGYYVYLYLRKSNLTPYYVGKGKGFRFCDTRSVKVPVDVSRIVIVEDNLTEVVAIARERELIRWYGRKDNNTGILRNLTAGGEGMSGYRHSAEAKRKIGVASKTAPKHSKGKFAWSKDGVVQYSVNCPGEGWVKGNSVNKGKSFEGRPSNVKNTVWYTNGIEQRRLINPPDSTWKLGRLAGSMQWWNNGKSNTRAETCPGVEWVTGRLLSPQAHGKNRT